jgi:hypothetical protein
MTPPKRLQHLPLMKGRTLRPGHAGSAGACAGALNMALRKAQRD